MGNIHGGQETNKKKSNIKIKGGEKIPIQLIVRDVYHELRKNTILELLQSDDFEIYLILLNNIGFTSETVEIIKKIINEDQENFILNLKNEMVKKIVGLMMTTVTFRLIQNVWAKSLQKCFSDKYDITISYKIEPN